MKLKNYKSKNDYIYWIIIVFIAVGAFYPIVGWLALICMLGPVLMAIWKGRYWCGHYCPRGSFYDNVMSRISLGKPVPSWLRSRVWRGFMLFFIFSMFGIQMSWAWGDLAAMGKVFWNIIVLTTVVGIVLAWLYTPRAWCMFCPMGTLSNIATRRTKVRRVHVADSCTMKCKNCARVCPMQLNPYLSKGKGEGFLDADCIKCERCSYACPSKAVENR